MCSRLRSFQRCVYSLLFSRRESSLFLLPIISVRRENFSAPAGDRHVTAPSRTWLGMPFTYSCSKSSTWRFSARFHSNSKETRNVPNEGTVQIIQFYSAVFYLSKRKKEDPLRNVRHRVHPDRGHVNVRASSLLSYFGQFCKLNSIENR